MTLERLWAGWRTAYVSDPGSGRADRSCVICDLIGATDDAAALVLERTPDTITVMNRETALALTLAAPSDAPPASTNVGDAKPCTSSRLVQAEPGAIE